jgi:hypothetical protein
MLPKKDNVVGWKFQYQTLLSRLCDGGVKIMDPRLCEEEGLDITSENCMSFVVVIMHRTRNRTHLQPVGVEVMKTYIILQNGTKLG